MTTTDPILALQRSTRRWAVVAGVAMLGAWAWALWPIAQTPLTLATTDKASSPAKPTAVAFNPDAFDVRLWTPPPAPPATPIVAQKPAPPPIKLQLIGISREAAEPGKDAVLRAALYDPDADKLLIVAAGETLTPGSGRPLTVASLTAEAVELSDGETTRKLSLNDERRTP